MPAGGSSYRSYFICASETFFFDIWAKSKKKKVSTMASEMIHSMDARDSKLSVMETNGLTRGFSSRPATLHPAGSSLLYVPNAVTSHQMNQFFRQILGVVSGSFEGLRHK